MYCKACGNEINDQAVMCVKCGVPTNIQTSSDLINGKSKMAAGLLGIFLGGLGIHKFYLNKPGLGVLYLLFCWTLIPSLVGLIEGIIYLTESDQSFAARIKM